MPRNAEDIMDELYKLDEQYSDLTQELDEIIDRRQEVLGEWNEYETKRKAAEDEEWRSMKL